MTQATELRELATLLDVSSGKVGIGLPSGTPSNSLVISDGVRTSAAITSGTTALEIARTSGGDVGILINKDTSKWLIGIDNSDGNAGPLRFMYGAYNVANHPGFGSAADGLNLSYDGAVGIGTKTPSDPLHVDTIHEVVARFESNSNNGTNLVIANADATTGRKAIVNLAPANNVTGALIGAEATEDFSSSAARTADLYFTTRANGTLEEKVRILSNGDVGIGTNAPVHKLDVDGAIATRQVRHSIRPTLNLDFANSKKINPLVSFGRDTVATYYDSKGVIRYANANEPRFDHDPITKESLGLLIEEEQHNYADHSVILWKAQTGNGNPYMAPNVAISPDGTFNASKLTISSTGNSYWSTLHSGNNTGTFWTASGYVKKYDHRYATILCLARFVNATYDLDTGTVVSTPSGMLADIIDVGNGWYRIWLRNDGIGTNDDFYFGSADTNAVIYNGVVGKGNYFWGIQVEEGKFPTSYIPSVNRFSGRVSVATYHDEDGLLTTAPKNTLRHGYKYDVESESWVETGPIYEPASTNRIFYSNWLNNVQGGCNFTANNDTSPTGAKNASLLHWDANSSNQMWVKSLDANGVYTCSGYFKYYQGATIIDFTLYAYQSSNGGYRGVRLTHVNSETMTVANAIGSNAVDAHGSEYVGNGWHRVWFTTTLENSSNQGYSEFNINREAVADVSASTDWLYYGGQMEVGPVMTSHIEVGPQPINTGRSWPNSGVTRAADAHINVEWPHARKADVAQINGSNIGDWFTQGKGTLYAEGISRDLDTYYPGFIELNKNPSGTTDRMHLLGRPSGIISFQIYKDNNAEAIISNLSGNMRTEVAKVALAYDENDVAFTFSGNSTPYLDTAVKIPKINYVSIGEQNEGYMNGTIKKIAYYPERLSDAEIQALTENN